MQNTIVNILTVSLSMSLVSLFLILLSVPMKRLKASCRYVLWLLVIVRLMLPFGGALLPKLFTIPVADEKAESVLDKESEPAVIDTITVPDPIYSSKGFTEILISESTQDSPEVKQNESVLTEQSMTEISAAEKRSEITEDGIALAVLMIWLGGAGIFLTLTLSSYLKNIHIIGRNLAKSDANARRIYRELSASMGIKRAPRLYICRAVRTPMIYGLIRQRVLLPEIPLAESDIRRVLSHELVHYKRRDIAVKFVALTANALHWFNPMAYIASKKLFAEMELSCDERVLKDADKEERIFYGVAMLEIVKRCRKSAPALTTGFNPKKKAVTQRFENILDTAKKHSGYSVIALLLCICILCTSIVGFAGESNGKLTEKTIEAQIEIPNETNYDILYTYTGDAVDIQPFYDMMDNSMDTLGISLLTSEDGQYIIDYNGNIGVKLPEEEMGFTYCSVCGKITNHNYYVDPVSLELVYEPSGHGGGYGHYIYDRDNDIICYTELGGYRICDEVDFGIAAEASLNDSEYEKEAMIDSYFGNTGDFVYTDNGTVFYRDRYISLDDNSYRESGGFGIICNSKIVTDFDHEGYLDFDAYGICALKKNGKWGYFNYRGEMILDYLYDATDNWTLGDHAQQIPYSSSSGVIALKRDGKWGYADIEGNILTDFVFEEARPASLGRAWVKLDGRWSVIAFDNFEQGLTAGEAVLLVKPFVEHHYYSIPNIDFKIISHHQKIDYYGMICYCFEVRIMESEECYTVAVTHDKAVYIVAPHYGEEAEIGEIG